MEATAPILFITEAIAPAPIKLAVVEDVLAIVLTQASRPSIFAETVDVAAMDADIFPIPIIFDVVVDIPFTVANNCKVAVVVEVAATVAEIDPDAKMLEITLPVPLVIDDRAPAPNKLLVTVSTPAIEAAAFIEPVIAALIVEVPAIVLTAGTLA